MQRLSPDHFGASEISSNQTFPGHVTNFGPHINQREVLVHCKLFTIINFADTIIDMKIVMHIGC